MHWKLLFQFSIILLGCCTGSVKLPLKPSYENVDYKMYYKYYKDYLGVYVPNGDILNGAPVYKNENGKMIHIRHERTVWSVGDADAVHDKGVLRADNQRAASPCLATATDWEFWDDRKGRNIPIHSIDFTLTCGKSQGDSLPYPRSMLQAGQA